MTRRGFLAGLLASVAAPALRAALPSIEWADTEIYTFTFVHPERVIFMCDPEERMVQWSYEDDPTDWTPRVHTGSITLPDVRNADAWLRERALAVVTQVEARLSQWRNIEARIAHALQGRPA